MLNEFGKNDLNTYAQGIELYATAKAEFNVIEFMKNKLIKAEPFDKSPDFREIIENAVVERRDSSLYSEKVVEGLI